MKLNYDKITISGPVGFRSDIIIPYVTSKGYENVRVLNADLRRWGYKPLGLFKGIAVAFGADVTTTKI
jgi:hypothetical protein